MGGSAVCKCVYWKSLFTSRAKTRTRTQWLSLDYIAPNEMMRQTKWRENLNDGDLIEYCLYNLHTNKDVWYRGKIISKCNGEITYSDVWRV